MVTRRRLLMIAGAASLAGPSAARTRWTGRALGAQASIELRGTGSAEAMRAALDTARRMERLFSLYDPNSELSVLNRSGSLRMSPEFSTLMDIVGDMNRLTGGLFDPTIQPLWKAASTGRDTGLVRRLIGWNKVVIDGQDIRFLQPRMAMTLNGIAQGFATDRVRSVLQSHGFYDVVVNIGEYAVGQGSAHLGLSRPDGQIIREVEVKDEAVATSSPGAMRLTQGLHHIVSPTGSQPSHVWDTVSVVASSATVADALSTAVCLTSNDMLARDLRRAGHVRKIFLTTRDGVHKAI